MSEGFAPRFAIEAAFLILLGVGAGYADLRTPVIVALVGAGWVIVALIELALWRSQRRSVVAYVAPPEPVEHEPDEAVENDVADRVEDVDYPLRADAGNAPSEEIEAYTRILGGGEIEPAQAAEAAAPPPLPPSS